jgi:hypothetical protein
MNPLRANANRLSACGLALRPWLWRTLLPAAVLDPSGQASPAEQQPCRTAGARFTAARVLGRARRRAWNVAGEQTGNTATTLAKRRRNVRACGPQYLRSAICACWVIRLGRVAHAATRGSVQAMARLPGGGNPDQSARRGKSSTQSLACALWVMAERQLDTLISSSPWNFETFPRSRG